MEYALVILCGGNSTRMGSDKALLPFGDYCLIEYLVHRFEPFYSKIYLSVKKKGDYAHLNLPAAEIPDIYPNAGPMSGVFSGLSMINEDAAFFMSVDTPFLEPQTGIALLDALGTSDICTLHRHSGQPETSTAVYSKNCITSIGKCLIKRQFTFQTLREKCSTRYLSEKELHHPKTPWDMQFYNLDTRTDYYHALRMASGIRHPDTAAALVEYFNDNEDLFVHTVPVISFVAKSGTLMAPFIERLVPLAQRDGLKTLYFTRQHEDLILHDMDFDLFKEGFADVITKSDMILLECVGTKACSSANNKVEILRKGWSVKPVFDETGLMAIIADFPYEPVSDIPVFDFHKPKGFLQFIHVFLAGGTLRC